MLSTWGLFVANMPLDFKAGRLMDFSYGMWQEGRGQGRKQLKKCAVILLQLC